MKRTRKRVSELARRVVELPDDIWLSILRLLPVDEQMSLSAACSRLRSFLGQTVMEIEATPQLTDNVLRLFQSLRVLTFPIDRNAKPKMSYLVTNRGIKSLPNLRELVRPPMLADSSLTRLSNLTVLKLDGKHEAVTDDGVRSLRHLTALELSGNETLTVNGLAKLPHLVTLRLSRCRFMGNSIRRLTRLTSLEVDDFSGNLTNTGIKGLTNLTSLALSDFQVFSDEAISRLTKLETLSLYCARVTDAGFYLLTNITGLSLLGIDSVTDDALTRLTKLTSLVLYGSAVTNHGMRQMTNLTALSLSAESVTDFGISGLTNLTSLELDDDDSITNAGISLLTNLTCLVSNDLITARGISHLVNLRTLDMGPDTKISERYLRRLTNLTALRQ